MSIMNISDELFDRNLKKFQFINEQLGYTIISTELRALQQHHKNYINDPINTPINQVSWDWHCGADKSNICNDGDNDNNNNSLLKITTLKFQQKHKPDDRATHRCANKEFIYLTNTKRCGDINDPSIKFDVNQHPIYRGKKIKPCGFTYIFVRFYILII